jgi:hypothetical protein
VLGGGAVVGDMARVRVLGVRHCWRRGSREGSGSADVAHETAAAAGTDGDVAHCGAMDAG